MRFSTVLSGMDAEDVQTAAAGLLRLLDGEAGALAGGVQDDAGGTARAAAFPDRSGGKRSAASLRAALTAALGAAGGFYGEMPADAGGAAGIRAPAEALVARGETAWDGSLRASATEAPETDTADRQALAEALEAIGAARRGVLSAAREETRPAGNGTAAERTAARGNSAGGTDTAGVAGTAGAERTLAPRSAGNDMEAVSEFFRRDSRRYDCGFGG